MPRKIFELTETELAALMDAAKPVPYLIVGGVGPRSPQERANAAWIALGLARGFDGMSVEPVPSKGPTFFTAEEM